MRVLIPHDPYAGAAPEAYSSKTGVWPCKWIACADAGLPPFVTAYRCRFTLGEPATIRAHVTADERYDLFLDGERIGRGSERGDANNWFFETYDLALSAGAHVMVAKVWSLGEKAAFAQMSVYPGFLFSPQEEEHQKLLGTGVAEWQAKKLGGYSFIDPLAAWGTGVNVEIDGSRFDWGFERGEGEGWQSAEVRDAGANADQKNDYAPMHLLRPATLPAMRDEVWSAGKVRLAAISTSETHAIPIRDADNLAGEAGEWQSLLRDGEPVIVGANTNRRILIDLENYVCAYPEVVTSGGKGGKVRVHWQESLYNEPDAKTKGNRNEIEGKYFVTLWHVKDGIGDTFLPDGGAKRRFDTLWWQCGRYVEVLVETADEPLTIESLKFLETRYPMERESEFSASDTRLEEVIPMAVRALQMCSHETYMDCPYYEQLMYAGDTRLEVLATYITTRDSRLPRKALYMFQTSRLPRGLTQSRYPSRVTQIIPPFSLWWVAMVYDWALWRGDRAFIESLMPDVRGVLDTYAGFMNKDGLVGAPDGWNYVDWVPAWDSGVPPGGKVGPCGPINWQYALVLTLAAKLEDWLGEPELAARSRRRATTLAESIHNAYWDEKRGLFADDLAKGHFSEHAQCLAILSGLLPDSARDRATQGLLSATDLARTTIYFTHYLFETFYALGRPDAFIDRMDLWFGLTKLGLKTTIEHPEPTRSDCHAWAAHPVYHYFASILGIRPASFGFDTVRIAPELGELTHAKGSLVHPNGTIEVELSADGGKLTGYVDLPAGVSGTFDFADQSLRLKPGRQEVLLDGNH
jgi:hypothetical protein